MTPGIERLWAREVVGRVRRDETLLHLDGVEHIATWHLVHQPLAPRTPCGIVVKYGARIRVWTDMPLEDRCRS